VKHMFPLTSAELGSDSDPSIALVKGGLPLAVVGEDAEAFTRNVGGFLTFPRGRGKAERTGDKHEQHRPGNRSSPRYNSDMLFSSIFFFAPAGLKAVDGKV